jgi:hypothetical protein
MAFNPTGRLHPEKYFSLEHIHLSPGNKVAEKDRFLFGRF